MKGLKQGYSYYSALILTILITFTPSGFSIVLGQTPPKATFDFQGRLLIVLSDADMISSSYFDGKLGPMVGLDALSVIRLNRPIQELKPVQITVSNSVTGPPVGLDVTPDGRYAIIGERLGPRPVNRTDVLLKDLQVGRKITVVDIFNPDQPKAVQVVEGPERANSVSVNANGSLVAVSFYATDSSLTSLVLYRFTNGVLTAPTYLNIPGWSAGDVIRHAAFHPKENILSVLNYTKSQVSFFENK